MISKIYAVIGRIMDVAASPLTGPYARRTTRVRALVLNQKNEVLLVRGWLSKQKWSLPGGGVKRSEPISGAAAREVLEESGVVINKNDVKPLGDFICYESTVSFTVKCVTVITMKQNPRISKLRRLEILESKWFKIDSLPDDICKTASAALAEAGVVGKKSV
ncbi:MAG: NUDIX hydrolase [Candidatus Woesebacteria bacterium]|jgi:ADP-ribose pyrophosphatase YjhB (NUDIX family)